MGSVLRVKPLCENIFPVFTLTGGQATKYHGSGSSGVGVNFSPIPSAKAECFSTKTGTSAPRAKPNDDNSLIGRFNSQRQLRASRVVAAFELPPDRKSTRLNSSHV